MWTRMIRLGKVYFSLCIRESRVKCWIKRSSLKRSSISSSVSQPHTRGFVEIIMRTRFSIRCKRFENFQSTLQFRTTIQNHDQYESNLKACEYKYLIFRLNRVFKLSLLINCFSDACGAHRCRYKRLSVYLSAIMLIWLPIHRLWTLYLKKKRGHRYHSHQPLSIPGRRCPNGTQREVATTKNRNLAERLRCHLLGCDLRAAATKPGLQFAHY